MILKLGILCAHKIEGYQFRTRTWDTGTENFVLALSPKLNWTFPFWKGLIGLGLSIKRGQLKCVLLFVTEQQTSGQARGSQKSQELRFQKNNDICKRQLRRHKKHFYHFYCRL